MAMPTFAHLVVGKVALSILQSQAAPILNGKNTAERAIESTYVPLRLDVLSHIANAPGGYAACLLRERLQKHLRSTFFAHGNIEGFDRTFHVLAKVVNLYRNFALVIAMPIALGLDRTPRQIALGHPKFPSLTCRQYGIPFEAFLSQQSFRRIKWVNNVEPDPSH